MGRFGTVASCLFSSIGGLAACADKGPVMPDAPIANDAAPDATPDAAPPAITVTAYNHYEYGATMEPKIPKAGVTVLVVSPTGAVGPTATTGSDGKASLENVVTGSSLFALYPIDGDGNYYATAVVGVKPGDDLSFGDNYWVRSGGTHLGTMDLAFPTPPANTTHVDIRSACFGSSYTATAAASISMAVYDTCANASAPLLVLARDNNAGVVTGYVNLTSPQYTVGSTVTLPAWIPVTANNVTVNATGLSSELSSFYVAARALFPPSNVVYAAESPARDNGTATSSFTLPGTSFLVSADYRRTGYNGMQRVVKAGASPLALGDATLPWIEDVTATGAMAQTTWTTMPGTTQPDVALLTLRFSRSSGKSSHEYYWNVVMPPDRTAFAFGDVASVPAALAPYLPEADSSFETQLRLIDLSAAPGYDGARNTPEWELRFPDAAVGLDGKPSISFSDGGEGYAVICPIDC